MSYTIRPAARNDLAASYEWIFGDNPAAAEAFLNSARDTFERLAKFPESGALARFKSKKLADVRFSVLPPPYQKWLVFYRVADGTLDIGRILYGTLNWRKEPSRFF
jgi:plasmid stabilization system protein ParE